MDDVDIRVRLRGARVAQAEAYGVAGGVDAIGGAAGRTRAHLSDLRPIADGVNGSLRKLGGAAKIGAIGVGILAGGVAGAVGVMGFGFNKTMDSQRVAFTTFMKSGKKAEKFMGQLQKLALQSPVLDPKSTGEAARTLMAYGVASKDVLPLVKAIGDMSAASGKSIAEVMPMAAMAIGQVASKGKLQAEELNQLAESVGLSRGRIRKALGMSKDEFEGAFKPGKSISAAKALPAIQKAMEAQSQGAADMLAKTTSGQLDHLKEVFSQKAGQITRGLWDGLGDAAGGLADKLQKINFRQVMRKARREIGKGFNQFQAGLSLGKEGKSANPLGFDMGSLGNVLGRGFKIAKDAAHDFFEALKPAKPFWDNVLKPFLQGFAIGLGAGIVGAAKLAWGAFKITMQVLGYLGSKLKWARGLFKVLGAIVGFIATGPVLKLVGAFSKVGRAVMSLPKFFRGPLGTVRKLIGGVVDFVAGLPGKFLSIGGKAASALVRGISRIPNMLKRAFAQGLGFAGNIARAMADWLNDNTPLGDKVNLPGPLPDFTMPALANGGILTNAGAVLVGERGPEVLSMPKGARVDPLPKGGPMAFAGAGAAAIDRRPVYLMADGRVMAEVVGRDTRNRVNRR